GEVLRRPAAGWLRTAAGDHLDVSFSGGQRRRAAGWRNGLTQPLSAGLSVTPGGTISSTRASTSSGSTTSAAAGWGSRGSIVRGPMVDPVGADNRLLHRETLLRPGVRGGGGLAG